MNLFQAPYARKRGVNMNMGGVEKVHEVHRFTKQAEDTIGRRKAKAGIRERA